MSGRPDSTNFRSILRSQKPASFGIKPAPPFLIPLFLQDHVFLRPQIQDSRRTCETRAQGRDRGRSAVAQTSAPGSFTQARTSARAHQRGPEAGTRTLTCACDSLHPHDTAPQSHNASRTNPRQACCLSARSPRQQNAHFRPHRPSPPPPNSVPLQITFSVAQTHSAPETTLYPAQRSTCFITR